jgi:hypothetical protein
LLDTELSTKGRTGNEEIIEEMRKCLDKQDSGEAVERVS